jgi:hypothetical protein
VVVMVGLQLVHNIAHPMPSVLPSPVISTWGPEHAWQNSFDGPDGHLQYNRPMAFYFFIVPLFSMFALGPALVLLLLLGIASIFRRPLGGGILLIGGWWLLFAAFYSGNIYQADRFILSFLPPLAVLSGLGLTWLLEQPGRRSPQQTEAIVPTANGLRETNARLPVGLLALAAGVLLALVGLGSALLGTVEDYRGLYNGKQDYLQAVKCTQDVVAQDGLSRPLFAFQLTLALRQYTVLEPHELYLEDPQSVDALLASSPTTDRSGALGYLVLPLGGFDRQWSSTGVGRTYYHLQSAYKLADVPCLGTSFSIFKIDAK